MLTRKEVSPHQGNFTRQKCKEKKVEFHFSIFKSEGKKGVM